MQRRGFLEEKHGNVQVCKGDTEAYEKHKRNYCLKWCPKSNCPGSCGVTVDAGGAHIGPHTCWKCSHTWSATGD